MCEAAWAAMGPMNANKCWAQDVVTNTPEHGPMDTRYHQVNGLIELLDCSEPSCPLGPAVLSPSLSARSSTEFAQCSDNVADNDETPRLASRQWARISEFQQEFVLLTRSSAASPASLSPTESWHCDDAYLACSAEDLATARNMWVPISKCEEKAKLSAGRSMHAWSIGEVSLEPDACARHCGKTRQDDLAALSCALEPRHFSPLILR